MARASKYWEARATTLAGKFEKALPLYRDLAENYRYDYYGPEPRKSLFQQNSQLPRMFKRKKSPFPICA